MLQCWESWEGLQVSVSSVFHTLKFQQLTGYKCPTVASFQLTTSKGYTAWVTTKHYFQHMCDVTMWGGGSQNPQNRVASCPVLPHGKCHSVTYMGLWKWQARTGRIANPIVCHTLLAQRAERPNLSHLTVWHIWSTDELHCKTSHWMLTETTLPNKILPMMSNKH